MEFQLSYFKSWKMMLWKCCTQYASKFGKLSSGHRTGKGQFSFQSQRKAMPKNGQTTAFALIAHTSKVVLKILQARLQEYVNCELPDIQAGFRKGRETRDQRLPTSVGSSKKQESSRKTSAAAAAKSLQSCPTLCDPIDSSPPGSPVLGILKARTLEWVAISFSNAWKWKVKVKSLNCV